MDVLPIPQVEIHPTRSYSNFIGVQHLYAFDNGYLASVVQSWSSFGGNDGLWEVGVGLGTVDSWSLTYDTPITDNVLGWLTDNDVAHVLLAISKLPKPCSS